MKAMGHKTWCIPDMYMKDEIVGDIPSHESISFINTGKYEAIVTITCVFENTGKKIVIAPVVIPPFESIHLRMDDLVFWTLEIPRNVPYATVIESTRKVVVEYARLNWLHGRMQSFAVMAYGED